MAVASYFMIGQVWEWSIFPSRVLNHSFNADLVAWSLEKYTFVTTCSFSLRQSISHTQTHIVIACHSPPLQSQKAMQVNVSVSWLVEVSPFDSGVPPKCDRGSGKFGWSYFGMRTGYWNVNTSVLSCARLLSWYLPWQFGCLNKTTPLTASSHGSSVVSLHHLLPTLPLLLLPTVHSIALPSSPWPFMLMGTNRTIGWWRLD